MITETGEKRLAERLQRVRERDADDLVALGAISNPDDEEESPSDDEDHEWPKIGYLCEDCSRTEASVYGKKHDTRKCRHCYDGD